MNDQNLLINEDQMENLANAPLETMQAHSESKSLIPRSVHFFDKKEDEF